MVVEVKIPTVGESVQEAILAEWFKQDGETVAQDEPLFVIETDKVTLEVTAEVGGVLRIKVSAGETVGIGSLVAIIEPSAAASAVASDQTAIPKTDAREPSQSTASEPASDAAEPDRADSPVARQKAAAVDLPLSPAVRRLVSEKQLDVGQIQGSGPGGRITKGDVLLYLEQAPAGVPESCPPPTELEIDAPPAEVRKPMTPIRKRIAARLVQAKQNTAMLTTFNDIDMGKVMVERAKYKERFKEKYDVSLGFMSFFLKACVAALKEIPEINAFVDDTDIVYHNYQHIGVAIGSGRGLVVPVIRHTEKLGFAEIEKAIIDYVEKIKANRLELADLEGGTFTISNGGVYGSLLSTPILNMPQSGILGMHRIEKRPVVVDDQVVIRPMMYVALSYDHRIVDGREAVTFLKRVKELIENPERLLLEV
jgi:2-oxoglutarate dehydrogenase E2 component (dihydrolipoamide succinyltransferase)